MKILITGGAGYKGTLLTEKLLSLGYKVTILDNFMYGYESILHLVKNKNLDILKLDIRNLTESVVKNYDVIYHLAGISGMPACASNPSSAESINVTATKHLTNFKSKEQILINASTTSLYGNFQGETAYEESEVVPVSIYGKTKYEAEKIIQDKENCTSFRFATVFGVSPKMRNDLMVNDFVYKSLTERNIVVFCGHSKRTFIHIDDAIDSYIFALENFEKVKNKVLNIGNGELNFSKIDIANNIKKVINFELIDSTLPDLDARNFQVSFNKINNLGFNTKFTLDDGIKQLKFVYDFYRYNLPYNII